MIRYVVSEYGYGRTLWLGERLRLQSSGALTPMKPHVYRGWDENCNPTLNLHLWPLFGIGWWWKRHQRTDDDGRCAECLAEDAEAPVSEENN